MTWRIYCRWLIYWCIIRRILLTLLCIGICFFVVHVAFIEPYISEPYSTVMLSDPDLHRDILFVANHDGRPLLPKERFIQYYETDPLLEIHNKLPSKRPKRILLWTYFFTVKDWVTDKDFTECPGDLRGACTVTTDRSLLLSSDAVMFHPRNISSTEDLPTQRFPRQRWVLFSSEPPMNNFMHLEQYNDIFNWTMLMRNDSDVPLHYGELVRVKPPDSTLHNQIQIIINRTVKAKTKFAAVRIANCWDEVYTKRIKLIRELQKYIPVDFHGKCGGINCSTHDCSDKALSNYKFHLSFENSFCKNYITEKFWKSLKVFSNIPVVMGGGSRDDYRIIAPQSTYINVADFSSIHDLASYLIYLDKHDDKYAEYLSWMFHYKVLFYDLTELLDPFQEGPIALDSDPAWCNLCAKLHSTSSPYQSYSDLLGFIASDTCRYRYR